MIAHRSVWNQRRRKEQNKWINKIAVVDTPVSAHRGSLLIFHRQLLSRHDDMSLVTPTRHAKSFIYVSNCEHNNVLLLACFKCTRPWACKIGFFCTWTSLCWLKKKKTNTEWLLILHVLLAWRRAKPLGKNSHIIVIGKLTTEQL